MATKHRTTFEATDPKLLTDLLLWVFDKFERDDRGNKFSTRARKIIKSIEGPFPRFGNRKSLEAFLPSDARQKADSNETKRYVYLNPIDKGGPIVPIMTFRYDLDRSIPEVCFRLGLFMMDSAHDVNAIGFRFEAPEGEGVHHYYHAQMITGFEKGDHSLNSRDWIPESQPAFILNAKNSVELFLCLLISLYGLNKIADLQLETFSSLLQKHINEMDITRFSPDYYEVEIDGSTKYCRTWHDRRRIKLIMESEGATRFGKSSRSAFEQSAERDRLVR